MARGTERLEKMRHNPRDDWRMRDVKVVCDELEITIRVQGAHFTVSHPTQKEILTMPVHRTVKPVYIRRFVKFVDAVRGATNVR